MRRSARPRVGIGSEVGPSVALVIAALAILAGCGTEAPLTPAPSSTTSVSIPPPRLTTIPVSTCQRAAVSGVIRSDPADPHFVWLEGSNGQRIDVVWPIGYRAEWKTLGTERYIEVYDARGRAFITTTDIPSPEHGCESGRPNTVLLMQTSP